MTGTADVTVVVVTWHARELVLRCLDSLAQQDLGDLHMEVVVVDNDSRDGTPEAIAAAHPTVTVVRSQENRGFAGGNNLALRSITSPVVILLNNDAIADRAFVAATCRRLHESSPDVAAVTGRVLLSASFRAARPDDVDIVHGPDGDWVIDPDGDVVLVNSTGNQIRTDGCGVDRGWLARSSTHQPDEAVFGFCGAAVGLRLAALADVGLFDDDFFLYYEDSDLSWRLRLAGYRVVYCADAIVRHDHATSTHEGSDLFRFHDWRNRLLMLTKDATAGLAARAVLRFIVTTASVALRRRGSGHEVRLRLRVLASYASLLPRALRNRAAITRRAHVARSVVQLELTTPEVSRGLRG